MVRLKRSGVSVMTTKVVKKPAPLAASLVDMSHNNRGVERMYVNGELYTERKIRKACAR